MSLAPITLFSLEQFIALTIPLKVETRSGRTYFFGYQLS